MPIVTPDGQVMDMDTGPVGALASQLSGIATTFVADLQASLDEADAIESGIGLGPMGRDFVRGIRQPLEDTKKLAQRLSTMVDDRARTLTTTQGIYVTAADASSQAFGTA